MKLIHAVLLTAITLVGCREDAPTLTEAERVAKLLTNGTWSLSSVSIDDTEASELFEDFSLTFTETGYTTTGTTPVWERNGTWAFTDTNSPTRFMREDEVEVIITKIEEETLVLELTWTKTTISGGRQYSIKGKHVFILIR